MIRKVIYRAIVMLAAVVSLGSCARVQEACGVVAEADSLRAVGQAFTDSVAIADAAEILYPVRLFYPTDYAHANYYYGRLLREHGDHPAAMEAFLRVVHSRTRDHAIKGRAYSNMGTMCNWANEFDLSYIMYLKCSEQVMLASDTTMYFYSLNAMALQLAEQKLYNETIELLNVISSECSDSAILTKTWETKAFLYFNVESYDSVINAVRRLENRGYRESAGFVKKAQAFWHLSQYDSALVCANAVMAMPYATDPDRYNMLYILTYNDSTIDEALIRQRSEERADIDKEKLDPLSLQYAQAAQILEQDLNRKPDLRWLFAVILTLIFIALVLTLYVRRKRRQHLLYSQQIDDLQQKKDELSEHTQRLGEVHSEYEENIKRDVEQFCQRILANPNPQTAISWDDYNKLYRIVNANLFNLADKLEEFGLVEHEIRFCVLVLLKLNRKDCAHWMNLGVSSIGRKKVNVANKLGQTSAQLYEFLLSLVCK